MWGRTMRYIEQANLGTNPTCVTHSNVEAWPPPCSCFVFEPMVNAQTTTRFAGRTIICLDSTTGIFVVILSLKKLSMPQVMGDLVGYVDWYAKVSKEDD